MCFDVLPSSNDNFTSPKADHKPFWVFLSVCRRSRSMACSTTKHLKNLSAAIPPSHHRFNVHRWDTAIQLLLENSARKKSFCIAIMAIESDQCFKGIGALAFVFTGLLLKDSFGLGARTSKKWVFAIGAPALPDTSSKRCSYCDLMQSTRSFEGEWVC